LGLAGALASGKSNNYKMASQLGIQKYRTAEVKRSKLVRSSRIALLKATFISAMGDRILLNDGNLNRKRPYAL